MEIKCPYNLNQFLLGEPIFENTFPKEECEQRKFYGDCYHCFSTAIAKRDNQLKNKDNMLDKIRTELKEKIEQEEFARSVFRHEEKDAVKAEQCTGSIIAYKNVIKLIDKYKIESEVQ